MPLWRPRLYPGGARRTELYRDDGISQAYRGGASQLTTFASATAERRLTVTIDPPDPHEHTLQVFAPSPPATVTADGATLTGWRHGDQFLTAALPASVTRIEVVWR